MVRVRGCPKPPHVDLQSVGKGVGRKAWLRVFNRRSYRIVDEGGAPWYPKMGIGLWTYSS